MTEKQIQHTIEMYHRKAMREPTKRLRAAIEQASKKRCWHNGWKHEGLLADYRILYEPMRVFLSEAHFDDICAVCDFLLKKANAQIERSDDDGDCAGQARFWMEKLLKALMKSEADIAEKTLWLEDFQKHDSALHGCRRIDQVERNPRWLLPQEAGGGPSAQVGDSPDHAQAAVAAEQNREGSWLHAQAGA